MNDTVDCFKQGLKCNENKINLSNIIENDDSFAVTEVGGLKRLSRQIPGPR